MAKKAVRLITLLLAIAMVATLAVGCGGNSGDSSTPGSTNSNVNAEEYRGTEITYVTWKDPALYEDGPVVEKFEKEYGIKVNVQLIDQKKYVSLISSSIAAGTQGDIFFETETFPGSLTVMQPLDAAKLDLTDPIWDQAMIKASTIDGHPYLVDTVSNIWAERDILVYNKAIFENNGITSPAEYYAQGKWTFENFRYVCQQVKALGKQYMGAGVIGQSALAAAGATLFDFKDNKMVVNADKRFYDAMTLLSQMKTDGLIGLGYERFGDGLHGMAITNCYALKKNGFYTNYNSVNLAATYLPVWKEGDEHTYTSLFRGWGLIDGAKNPVAAGLFLREYLDVTNYDVSKAFHNADVANFFFQATGDSTNKIFYYTAAMGRIYDNDHRIYEDWSKYSPAQMTSYLDGKKNVLNSMVTKANADIENERKWIKENFGE